MSSAHQNDDVRQMPRRIVHPFGRYRPLTNDDINGHYEAYCGHVCLAGKLSGIYVASSACDTLVVPRLIMTLLGASRTSYRRIYYLYHNVTNQDFAMKFRSIDELYGTLICDAAADQNLVSILNEAADNGSAQATSIILDPVFQAWSPEMAAACRKYVVSGGTVVALIYETTRGDVIVENFARHFQDELADFDAVYRIDRLESKSTNTKLVRFSGLLTDENCIFAYFEDAHADYVEVMASIRLAGDVRLENYAPAATYCRW